MKRPRYLEDPEFGGPPPPPAPMPIEKGGLPHALTWVLPALGIITMWAACFLGDLR